MILSSRSKKIDFLRGIAVLLVVLFHYPSIKIINRMGWVGVDLFFVLSGFLVSGLIFKEYLQYGKVNLKLFLIRRGFKIYPLFFFFMGVTICIRLLLNEPLTLKQTLGEIFFIRNYIGGYWIHTWSLSVEEQFYFFLAAVAFFAVKYGWIKNLKAVNLFFISFFIFCAVARSIDAFLEHKYGTNSLLNVWARNVHTHFRIDSLLFGVFISYFFHFKTQQLKNFTDRYKKILLPVFVVLISPVFFLTNTHLFISTAGFSLLYLGFGALLVYFISAKKLEQKILLTPGKYLFNAIAFIGVYSYAIYLWHFFVRIYVMDEWVQKWQLNHNIEIVIYVCISLLAGFIFSKYIEYYFLAVRDKYFPSKKNTDKPV